MASVKLSALVAIAAASITATDIVPMSDIDVGLPTTYKATMASMRTALLTAIGAGWTASDYLALGSAPTASGMIRVGQGALVGASTPLINSSATWNNAATTFQHIIVNVTNTASNAASTLMDLQAGAGGVTSMWKVTAAGAVTQASSLTVTAGGLTVSAGTTAVQALTATTGVFSSSVSMTQLTATTGGTFGDNATASNLLVSLNRPAGQNRFVRFQTAGVVRWDVGANNAAEGGADAGSNYQIAAYTDGAVLIDVPITIARAASGTITMNRLATLTAGLTVSAGTSSLQAVTATTVTATSDVFAGAATRLGWTGRSVMRSPADGIVDLLNNAETGFSRLQFGGTTASFGAIRVGGTTTQLEFVLADNSAFTSMRASIGTFATGTAASAGSLRLQNAGLVAWRNAGNTADHTLQLTAGDLFSFSTSVQISAGNLNVAAGGGTFAAVVTVTAGGIAVTGNSTITGSLGGVTSLTIAGALAGATTGAFSSTITSAIGAVGVNTPAYSSTATWNVGGTTYQHIFANITNTASAAASTLIDLQVGAASQFKVTVGGAATIANGLTVSASGITVTAGGLTVSAGTSALQALTATTGVFSSNVGITGTATVTSSSATSLTVGLNGATNPAFTVDSSTALQVAGLKVTGAVTGGTVAVAVTDSGANANLSLDAKGSGTIVIAGTSTGAITLSRATTVSAGGLTVSAGTTAVQALTATTGVFSSTGQFGNTLTVTAGGLTVSAGTTAVQALTATTGTFSAKLTTAAALAIASTQIFYLDGVAATGDTYITESAANTLDIYTGGGGSFSVYPGGTKMLFANASGIAGFLNMGSNRVWMAVGSGGTQQLEFQLNSAVYGVTNGNIIYSTNAGTYPLGFNGSTYHFMNIATTANAANAFLDSATGNQLMRSTSSARYKTLLHPLALDSARTVILGAEPWVYEDKNRPGTQHIGLVAEQMALLDGRVVTYDDEGRPDWVQYPHLTAPLMLVAQDHEARLARLEQRLADHSII
jgi:hypothetical protein